MLDIAGQVMSLMDPNFNKPSGPVSTKIQNRTTPHVLQVIPHKTGGKYSKNVYKKVGKKEVLGKDRVIYKMKGSNKEYLKTKGIYIPVTEYKKINITKK